MDVREVGMQREDVQDKEIWRGKTRIFDCCGYECDSSSQNSKVDAIYEKCPKIVIFATVHGKKSAYCDVTCVRGYCWNNNNNKAKEPVEANDLLSSVQFSFFHRTS